MKKLRHCHPVCRWNRSIDYLKYTCARIGSSGGSSWGALGRKQALGGLCAYVSVCKNKLWFWMILMTLLFCLFHSHPWNPKHLRIYPHNFYSSERGSQIAGPWPRGPRPLPTPPTLSAGHANMNSYKNWLSFSLRSLNWMSNAYILIVHTHGTFVYRPTVNKWCIIPRKRCKS